MAEDREDPVQSGDREDTQYLLLLDDKAHVSAGFAHDSQNTNKHRQAR